MHSVLKVISLFNRLAATPLSLECNTLIKKGAFKDLVSLKVDPTTYTESWPYRVDAQVISLVRKLAGLPTGVDLRKAALDSFYGAERECSLSNNRLSFWVNSQERGFVSDSEADHSIYEIISNIRKRVGSVLGPLPKDLDLRFGNGSTYGDRGRMITICHKMSSHMTVTARAVPYLDLVRQSLWWSATDKAPIVVKGNRFTTVAKDSEKDRGIAIEPSVNVSLQLAVGTLIRERLKAVGIHIDGKSRENAQSIHRDLARHGSLTGDLATIDLSSASDTICVNLVKLLLPRSWFSLLDDLRSHETEVDGKWLKCHKFSSMGNGFTFELETLLFWAISSEIASVSKVYGDDIIIPTRSYNDVIWGLRFFGFTPNPKKSFGTGPFRESCGGDYFNGVSVRPIFLKKIPNSPLEWITTHNLIMRACENMCFDEASTKRISNAIISNIPRQCLYWGPSNLDGVLHGAHGRRVTKYKDGVSYVRGLIPVPKKVNIMDFSPGVQLASALLGAPSKGVPLRDSVSGWKRGWFAIE